MFCVAGLNFQDIFPQDVDVKCNSFSSPKDYCGIITPIIGHPHCHNKLGECVFVELFSPLEEDFWYAICADLQLGKSEFTLHGD